MGLRELGRIAGTPYRCESMLRLYRACYLRTARRGASVFLACMPKSGSTFLYSALAEVTGFRVAYMGYAKERSEQELYLPRLIDHLPHDTITQQHPRATEPNLSLLRAFDIHPVILTRNLYDVAVSARHHLNTEGHQRFPALYATPRYYDMNAAEQTAFVISFVMPWYVQFYVSWYEAWRHASLPMLWLRYEDLVEDWETGIARVLDFYELDYTHERLRAALPRAYGSRLVAARLNRGVVGRGMSELSAEQRERIRALTRHYPEVDFSSVLEADDRAAAAG